MSSSLLSTNPKVQLHCGLWQIRQDLVVWCFIRTCLVHGIREREHYRFQYYTTGRLDGWTVGRLGGWTEAIPVGAWMSRPWRRMSAERPGSQAHRSANIAKHKDYENERVVFTHLPISSQSNPMAHRYVVNSDINTEGVWGKYDNVEPRFDIR